MGNLSGLKIIKYEVIADFPASMFEVGDTVSVYESAGTAYMVEVNECSAKYDVRDFPHLFKRVGYQGVNEGSPAQSERHELEIEIYQATKNIGNREEKLSIDKLRRIAEILRER